MKQFLLAAALLAFAAQPVFAKGTKKKSSHAAASNTDHSYDRAYSAQWAHTAKRPGTPVNARAAMQSNIRKSTYAGYTTVAAPWYPSSQAANADQAATFQRRTVDLQGVTIRENANDGYLRPSPYLGDDGPTNDGAKMNEHRNMNVANSAQPLPPSVGQSGNR